jgi:uncharacterized membrane protein YfcA
MNLTAGQWAFLAVGALFVGLAKTGVPGLGVLTVALFANALPARESTGALLPLLLCADVIGVAIYRKHASWPHLIKLLPWVLIGVVAGYFALGKFTNSQVQRMIGVILLAMTGLHLWRQRTDSREQNEAASPTSAPNGGESQAIPLAPVGLPHSSWFVALTGILAGFTTMVANAAGPVMVLYLLAVQLPKLAFVGTWAWFFLLVNLSKMPLSIHLGLIHLDSLKLDALLLIAMVPGALLGPIIVKHINQRVFEWLALGLTVLAALRLLF